ncbi:TetR/AcrR family transcriptional regulator [Pseudogulbenkiania sp. MAI-1]|uniref:TetR/AcrR family transcriptional regulator n=1 Tax=Pseudogulbenkiania sp. MAI-1 TaxID=990370 RepID=UPI00045E711E|nr:TetR/AcrR family transcriptional regulator [Pseudogulbenkiania sp. MAI-1]
MARPSSYPDTREHILSTGEDLIYGLGFTALGLTELLKTAGVPKGSFYHYFESKEDFGVELLARYFDNYDATMRALLTDPANGTGRTRLLAYFQRWMDCANTGPHLSRCLVVKMAGEVCDLSEPMREQLIAGMNRVTARLAEGIRAAVADGSLAPVDDAEGLAEALYSAWLGAALRVKVLRDPSCLERLLIDTKRRLVVPH